MAAASGTNGTDLHGPAGGPSILIAEDESTNAMLMRVILERAGCAVEVVSTGVAARDRVATQCPDLVFMDVQMPEMNGDDAVRAIRRAETEEQRPRTPIVALSAHVLESVERRLLDAGCNEYMTKPVQPDLVTATVERLLGLELAPPQA